MLYTPKEMQHCGWSVSNLFVVVNLLHRLRVDKRYLVFHFHTDATSTPLLEILPFYFELLYGDTTTMVEWIELEKNWT